MFSSPPPSRPTARELLFTETTSATSDDVMQVEMTGTHTVTPLVQSPFIERNGIVSPDGRWLAYEANDSGQLEIYVRPYPDVNSGRWQVSTGGGHAAPLVAHRAGAVLRVAGRRDHAGGRGAGRIVGGDDADDYRQEGYMTALTGFVGRTYDISPDGQRFLMVKPANEPNAPPPQLVVVQHFDEELKRLVPTK